MKLTNKETEKLVKAFFKASRNELRPGTIHGLCVQIDKKYSRQTANALEYMRMHTPPLLIRYSGEWHATEFRHNCRERGCVLSGRKNGEISYMLDMGAFRECINYWIRLEWIIEGIFGDFHKYSLSEIWQGLKGALGRGKEG